jgi:hypothetical protein
MTSDITAVYCVKCQKQIPEHHLNAKSVRVESCPHCGETVRTEEGVQGANVAAANRGDIAAVDAWLEDYANAHNIKVERRTGRHGSHVWIVERYPRTCEVIYDPRKLDFVALRLTLSEGGQTIVANCKDVQRICAIRGVQPRGSRTTDALKGTVTYDWGAEQFLSTNSLCGELFDAVVSRLDDAVEDILQKFGGK